MSAGIWDRINDEVGDMVLEPEKYRQHIPDLIAALSDDENLDKSAVAMALGYLGDVAIGAIPALYATLSSRNDWVRICAASAIWKIQPGDERVVQVLIDELEKENGAAADEISFLTPPPENALPIYLKMCAHQESYFRYRGVIALGRMGARGKEALPVLRSLNKDEAHIRDAAAAAIAKIEAQ